MTSAGSDQCGTRCRARLCDRLLERCRATPDQRHRVPCPQQADGHGPADTAAGAGHESNACWCHHGANGSMGRPLHAGDPTAMTVLVTGGAGFLGTRLIQSLLAGASGPAPTRVICVDQVASAVEDSRVVSVIGSVADAGVLRAAVPPDVTDDLAPGRRPEWPVRGRTRPRHGGQRRRHAGAARRVPDAARPPRFVFSSTVAVFGGPLPAVVPEDHALRPASTYGTTKAIAELLVLEATRRGLVDGIACRVPTVSVRPGRPNSAMSSFVSGIVREPLAGIESVCPVPLDTRLWVSSPAITTANLAHAGRLPAAMLQGVRTINLPGICVTPAQLLDSLERAAGAAVRSLVRLEPDARIAAVVEGWPGAFDASRALRLGFSADRDADALVTQFIADRATA